MYYCCTTQTLLFLAPWYSFVRSITTKVYRSTRSEASPGLPPFLFRFGVYCCCGSTGDSNVPVDGIPLGSSLGRRQMTLWWCLVFVFFAEIAGA